MIRLTLMLTIATNVAFQRWLILHDFRRKSSNYPSRNSFSNPRGMTSRSGAWISHSCISNLGAPLKLEAIRVNGTQPTSATLYLKQTGNNQFELPALKIEFSSEELGGPLYMNLKVWFNELTNQYDSFVYEQLPDRYAIVSYCTNEDDDPSKVNARLARIAWQS